MRHFDLNEWTSYTKGLVDEEVRVEMESHLFTCDECLEVYLTTIEEGQIQQTEGLTSLSFVDQVMREVSHRGIFKEKDNKSRYSSKIFLYYTAAACITLILTFSGTFRFLSDNMSSSTIRITESSVGIEEMLVNGWSEQVVTKTFDFMNTIKLKHFKE